MCYIVCSFCVFFVCFDWSCCCIVYIFFFFKQKTAYEMRISDWSSDVCSSDLEALVASMLDADIWRPLSNTRLKSGPTPRTVTFEPSPIEQIGRASSRERVCQYV